MKPATRVLAALLLAVLAVGCASTETTTSEERIIPKEPGERDLRLYREGDENRLFIELNSLMTRWEEAALKHDEVVLVGIREQIERYVLANFALVRDALRSENERFRMVAAGTVGFGKRKEVIPTLMELLTEEDEYLLSNALLSLGELSPLNHRLGRVSALLEHESISVRSNAVRVMARNLEEEDQATYFGAIQHALDDEDGVVRLQAIGAMMRLGGPGAVREIAKRTKDPYKRVRIRAALALGEMGDVAGNAVPDLIAVLDNQDLDERQAAASSLARITGQDFDLDAPAWTRYWETSSDRGGSAVPN